MTPERKRGFLLIAILSIVSLMAVSTTSYFLYLEEIDERRDRLVEIVKSQAMLIEAIANFATIRHPDEVKEAVISQITAASKKS